MKRLSIADAALLMGVSKQTLRVMIITKVIPSNVAAYVKRPKCKRGSYVIWAEPLKEYLHGQLITTPEDGDGADKRVS